MSVHQAAGAGSVLILNEDSPLSGKIESGLNERGIPARLVSVADAATSAAVRPDRNLWIAAGLRECSADKTSAIVDHLEAGGGLLVLGEPPFQSIVHNWDGAWISDSAFRAAHVRPRPLIEWTSATVQQAVIATDTPQTSSRAEWTELDLPEAETSRRRQAGVRVIIPEFKGWMTFQFPLTHSAERGAATTFWAKGTTETTQLAVELREKDGSRWIARPVLKPGWEFYTLFPRDFTFFHDADAPGRGGSGDSLHMDNAALIMVGLAQTHTQVGPGPHEFVLGPIGTVPQAEAGVKDGVSVPLIDCVSPVNMVYPIQPGSVHLNPSFKHLVGLDREVGDELLLPDRAWSSYWRTMGTGLDKKRMQRFIPVVTAGNVGGKRAGTLAAIVLSFRPPFRDSVYGYVSISDETILTSPAWLDVVAVMAQRMRDRTLFAEAGSTEYTYDTRNLVEGQFEFGARTADMMIDNPTTATPQIRLSLIAGGHALMSKTVPCAGTGSGEIRERAPLAGASGDYIGFRAELIVADRTVDMIEHEIGIEGPRSKQEFLKAANRAFERGGKPWRMFGINYLPSSQLMMPSPSEFELWIEDPSYDPDIVEADLARIEELGFNSVAAFVYEAGTDKCNVLDFLRRARRRNLMVFLSLRPNHPPFPISDAHIERLMTGFRLWEKDEIAAFDLAWEPWWGEQTRRRKQSHRWRTWVEREYGSQESAERKWKYKLGELKLEEFPTDAHLRVDGAWTHAVADYRRFVDETLHAAYSDARRKIRELDPNHMVTFRQSEGANPLVDPAQYPIELRSICDAVDIYCPEGYGIGTETTKTETMLFAASYGEGLSPGKPMIWGEYGFNTWSGDPFFPKQVLLDKQAHVFRNILENADRSRAAGTLAWWFPGGFRRGEDSDYGVLNPDGMDRTATKVIREYAERAKSQPPPVKWTPKIHTSRDKSVTGYVGIFDRTYPRFLEAVTSDTIPLLVTREN